MPIYEYECQKCGTFEASQKITDRPLTKCPTCKGKVKKLISNTSFQLKGTGWYITDYARKGKNGEAKSDSGTQSSTESKTESKSETKKSESSSSGDTKSASTSSAASTTHSH
jgi:putative FmdB family regulatory protein